MDYFNQKTLILLPCFEKIFFLIGPQVRCRVNLYVLHHEVKHTHSSSPSFLVLWLCMEPKFHNISLYI